MIPLILAVLIVGSAHPALVQPGDWRYRDRHDGVHLRILRDYELKVVLVVALLLTIVAPDWVGGMARRVSGSPLGSAAIGLAGQILFVPALVALTIALVLSVVGILLFVAYPFLFGALAVMWVAGYAAVAMTLGARLRGRDVVTSRAPIVDLLTGFLLISALTLLAQAWTVAGGYFGPGPWAARAAGWIVEWFAWTVAFGAALASVFGSRQPVTPPRLPYVTPAPTPS